MAAWMMGLTDEWLVRSVTALTSDPPVTPGES